MTRTWVKITNDKRMLSFIDVCNYLAICYFSRQKNEYHDVSELLQ